MPNDRPVKLQLFESVHIRTAWDESEEKWWFSIVDVVATLTESVDATAYWRKLKQRLKAEGNETVTNCHGLKMKAADGKLRMTDVADTEQLLRLVQSIPSKKAEPFKLWLAELSTKEISEAVQPQTLDEHESVAKRGGGVARQARLKLELETGKKLVSPKNAKQLRLLNQKKNKRDRNG